MSTDEITTHDALCKVITLARSHVLFGDMREIDKEEARAKIAYIEAVVSHFGQLLDNLTPNVRNKDD